MYKYKTIVIIALLLISKIILAQDLRAKVTVLSGRINSTIDKKIFTTLQSQLNTLMNNRKWTNDLFKENEKIECSFILNLESIVDPNVYKASLTVQVARPVYNTSYQAALVNFIDPDVTFKYIEFQPQKIPKLLPNCSVKRTKMSMTQVQQVPLSVS